MTCEAPIKQAVLLVGGLGTRLRPLTLRRPKALIPVLNRPLISYELELLARHGVRDVIMAVSYGAAALQAELGDGAQWGVRLRYVEEEERLGTAGAIKNVEDLIEGPFLAMNGDLVMDVDLGAAMAEHTRSEAVLTLCLRRVEDISAYGLIRRNEDGWVTDFLEKRPHDETGQNTVNSGVYVMSPQILAHIPAGRAWSNEFNLFPDLLEAGLGVRGHVPDHWGYWNDIGRVSNYLDANRALLGGAIEWVETGVAAEACVAADARVTETCLVGADAQIAAGGQVGPDVTVGGGASIGEGAHVTDSVLWPGAQVGAGAYVAGSIVGSPDTSEGVMSDA